MRICNLLGLFMLRRAALREAWFINRKSIWSGFQSVSNFTCIIWHILQWDVMFCDVQVQRSPMS